MNKTFLFAFLLIFQIAFSQIEKRNMDAGEITLVTNDKILFKNLSWKNDKAYYTNPTNNLPEELFDASIKNIEEKDISTQLAPVVTKVEPKKDNLFRPDYPEGIYATKEDFIKKIPTSNPPISKLGLVGFNKSPVGDEEKNCFFYDTKNSKLKNTFAVVHKGLLYFSVNGILSNRNKNDRAQGSDFPNSFVQALFGGDNYIYTEAELANIWAKGLAYSGGAVGGAIASTLDTAKGIVWDFKNSEFNIFKNCSDYNDFVKTVAPDEAQKCENQQPNNIFVRQTINKIK